MILNLRGSYGAGKTTIFRRLIDEHDHHALYGVNVRQDKDRRVPIVWQVGDLYLLGRWRVGSDGIRHRPLAELIQLFSDRGHVIYENVLVSANFQMWKKLRDELFADKALTLGLLDTTEQQCIDAVQQRRAEAKARGWNHRQENVNEDAARGHWRYVQKTTKAWADAGEHVVTIPRDCGYNEVWHLLSDHGWRPAAADLTAGCNHFDGECHASACRLPSLPFTRRPFRGVPDGPGQQIAPIARLDIRARELLAPRGPVGNCGHVRGGLDSYSLPISSTPDFRFCRTCMEAVLPQYGCDSCGKLFRAGEPCVYHIISSTTWGGKAIEDHFVIPVCGKCCGGVPLEQHGVALEVFDRNDRTEFMVVDACTSAGFIGALPIQEYTEKQAAKLADRLARLP